ncbi:MAG: hypothetical protein LR015_00130 [Verrucomicrobia bacterium]|nr:hypothetical protein [Verrucomicrobiota bacterium]
MAKDMEREADQPTAFPDEDAALMLRVASGDESALRDLIDKWKNPLINFFLQVPALDRIG